MKSKKTCIITGTQGFIASHLIPNLQDEYQIFALVRRDAPQNNENITYINADLRDPDFTEKLPAKADIIIHLAQSRHYREFPEKASDIFHTNTSSTFALFDYSRKAGVKTFVVGSSGIVYGYDTPECVEVQNISLNSKKLGFYYASKLCAEAIADSFSAFMNVITLRFFFVYGKNQGETMLIPRLIKNVREGNPITLQGIDGIKINPIHVDDAIESIKKALHLSSSEKINIAGDEILSLREISISLGESLNRTPNFIVDDKTPPQNLIGNNGKMKSLLHHPKVSFEAFCSTIKF